MTTAAQTSAQTPVLELWPGKAYQRVKDAGNMTDRLNALQALSAGGERIGAAGWA